MSEAISTCPLCWPSGWKRTPKGERAVARFTKGASRLSSTGQPYRHFQVLSANDATDRLIAELMRLGVESRHDIIISTNIPTRLDGTPYSNTKEPEDPGVAVYWAHKGKRQCMAVDRYNRVADNIAAVAATIDAMRAIERHGGAAIMERAFLGFQSLPAPKTWRDVLGVGDSMSPVDITKAYRQMAMIHHPDKGGNEDIFKEIKSAFDAARKELNW